MLIVAIAFILTYLLFKEYTKLKFVFILSLSPLIIHSALYFYAIFWNRKIGTMLFKISLVASFAASLILLIISAKAWYMNAVYNSDILIEFANPFSKLSLWFFLIISIIANLVLSLFLMRLNSKEPKDAQKNLAKLMAAIYSILRGDLGAGVDCHGRLAYYRNDTSICDIPSERRDDCIFAYSIKTLDKDYCEEITDRKQHDNCIAAIDLYN